MKKIAVLFLFFVFIFSFLSYWVFSEKQLSSSTISGSYKQKILENIEKRINEVKKQIEETQKKRNEARDAEPKILLDGELKRLEEELSGLMIIQSNFSRATEVGRPGEKRLGISGWKSFSLPEFGNILIDKGKFEPLFEKIEKRINEVNKQIKETKEKRTDARDASEKISLERDLEKLEEELPGLVIMRRDLSQAIPMPSTEEERGDDDERSSSAFEIAVSCVAETGASLGGGLKSFFVDTVPWAAGKVGGALSGVPEGLVSIDEALTQYGGAAKLGLFSIFSALAQYQYTRKGSKNSQTQIFRAVAITLGQDMGIKNQLPRGLEGAIDPLKPFKREPLSLQQRLDSQEKILNTVLTMGGDPSIPGGFPAGTHEQLQRILKGSVLPGGVPDFSAPPGFPGVYDPSFVNFSRQAFNGFPPFPTTQTRGALLNPGFASDNPFSRGSTAASGNFKTLSHGDGVATVGNVASATAVLTAGVRDFSTQLEEINPQDNSLKSLIDDIPLRESRGITLQKSKNDLAALLSNPRETFFRSLQQEQATLIIQKQNEIVQLNKELFDATLEFRRRDFYVQPDEDGLLPSGAKDFSKNFERRTEALIRLQELTRKRAATIEGLALIRGNLPLFKRLQSGGQLPTGSPIFQPPTPPLAPLGFVIRPLWAVEKVEPPKFVPNWRAMVRDEIQKVDREIENNRKALGSNLSQLQSLVLLDPDGVHEINAEVVQREKFNLKALAWQARDNLGKLERAASDIAIDIKTRSDLESYKAAFSKLEKAAHTGANELARVERLQREKMERSDLFDAYQEMAKQIIAKSAQ